MDAVIGHDLAGAVPRSQAPPGNAYLKALPYTPKTGAIHTANRRQINLEPGTPCSVNDYMRRNLLNRGASERLRLP